MKTLVIHPNDLSTKYLSKIYEADDATVIKTDIPNGALMSLIKSHDRIIMMGHGSEDGLFGHRKMVIDSKFVYLLRQKECVAIWCNADVFFKKYELTGIYTGMIISELDEALSYSIYPVTGQMVKHSNYLFAELLEKFLYIKGGIDDFIAYYHSEENNPVIDFNRQRVYVTGNSKFK